MAPETQCEKQREEFVYVSLEHETIPLRMPHGLRQVTPGLL